MTLNTTHDQTRALLADLVDDLAAVDLQLERLGND